MRRIKLGPKTTMLLQDKEAGDLETSCTTFIDGFEGGLRVTPHTFPMVAYAKAAGYRYDDLGWHSLYTHDAMHTFICQWIGLPYSPTLAYEICDQNLGGDPITYLGKLYCHYDMRQREEDLASALQRLTHGVDEWDPGISAEMKFHTSYEYWQRFWAIKGIRIKSITSTERVVNAALEFMDRKRLDLLPRSDHWRLTEAPRTRVSADVRFLGARTFLGHRSVF